MDGWFSCRCIHRLGIIKPEHGLDQNVRQSSTEPLSAVTFGPAMWREREGHGSWNSLSLRKDNSRQKQYVVETNLSEAISFVGAIDLQCAVLSPLGSYLWHWNHQRRTRSPLNSHLEGIEMNQWHTPKRNGFSRSPSTCTELSKRLHTKGCWLGFNLTVHARLSCSEWSWRQQDHGHWITWQSKMEARTGEL